MEALVIILSVLVVALIGAFGIYKQRADLAEVDKAKAERIADKERRKAQEEKKRADQAIEERNKIVEDYAQRTDIIKSKVNEINQSYRWIEEQTALLLIEKRKAEEEMAGAGQLVEWANNEIFKAREQYKDIHQLHKDAHDAIKENKVKLFELKENGLWLYDHYKKTVELLKVALNEDTPYIEVMSALQTATNNMYVVRQRFMREFRQTPEDYSNQKISAEGTNQSGGKEEIKGFSKN